MGRFQSSNYALSCAFPVGLRRDIKLLYKKKHVQLKAHNSREEFHVMPVTYVYRKLSDRQSVWHAFDRLTDRLNVQLTSDVGCVTQSVKTCVLRSAAVFLPTFKNSAAANYLLYTGFLQHKCAVVLCRESEEFWQERTSGCWRRRRQNTTAHFDATTATNDAASQRANSLKVYISETNEICRLNINASGFCQSVQVLVLYDGSFYMQRSSRNQLTLWISG